MPSQRGEAIPVRAVSSVWSPPRRVNCGSFPVILEAGGGAVFGRGPWLDQAENVGEDEGRVGGDVLAATALRWGCLTDLARAPFPGQGFRAAWG